MNDVSRYKILFHDLSLWVAHTFGKYLNRFLRFFFRILLFFTPLFFSYCLLFSVAFQSPVIKIYPHTITMVYSNKSQFQKILIII